LRGLGVTLRLSGLQEFIECQRTSADYTLLFFIETRFRGKRLYLEISFGVILRLESRDSLAHYFTIGGLGFTEGFLKRCGDLLNRKGSRWGAAVIAAANR
jgi:hypothetical protein